MKRWLVLTTAFLATSLYAIEGIYDVQGYDPYIQKKYSGGAFITKDQNGVYQARWNTEGKKYVGTGLMSENEISFIFTSPDDPNATGVQIYKIEGTTLKGSWVLLGKSLVGSETLTLKSS